VNLIIGVSTEKGLGVRTGRYALVIDDLKVTYVGVSTFRYLDRGFIDNFVKVEPGPGVSVSGADAILSKL
jgi:alkyl hydroperoxide reductase 1